MFGKTTSASGQKPPISSHPIFPVVVAIWFAALLGIGSLILPVALFEKIFALTGVSSLIPAAQAPLGFTARMLISIAAAGGGAIAGVFVARKVAASQSLTKSASVRSDDENDREHASKRPISALEELGSDSLDDPIADQPSKQDNYKGKRRSLAVTDDSGPSDFLELAPLPGGDLAFDEETLNAPDNRHHTLDLDEFADEGDEGDEADDAELMATLNGPFGQPTASQTAQTAVPTAVDFASVDTADTFRPTAVQPLSETHAAEALREELAPMPDRNHQNTGNPHDSGSYNPLADKRDSGQQYAKPFSPTSPEGIQPEIEFAAALAENAKEPEPVPQAQSAPTADHARPLNELGMVELVERFASALQTKRAGAEADKHGASEPAQDVAAIPAQHVVAAPSVVPDSFPPRQSGMPSAALEEESAESAVATPVEPAPSPLVFRRASAPQTALEPAAEKAAAPTAAQEPVYSEMSTQSFAEQHTAPPSIPSALQPLGFDESEDDDDFGESPNLGLSIDSLRTSAPRQEADPSAPAPFSAPEQQQPEYTEIPEADDSYSSLLHMRNTLGGNREFVRIEDDDVAAPAEPVVVFPGHDGASTGAKQSTPQFSPPPTATDAPRPFDGPGVPSIPKSGEPAPNAGETERALREALEKLQRMSGAA